MDTFLVLSALQEVKVAQWKLLGMSLPIPWNKLDDIENDDSSFPGDIAKKEEVIRLWMSQEPTWIVLVDALSQSAYEWSQNSSQISQKHSKYLTIIRYINCLFMRALYNNYRCASTKENSRKRFISPS